MIFLYHTRCTKLVDLDQDLNIIIDLPVFYTVGYDILAFAYSNILHVSGVYVKNVSNE